MPNVQIIQMGPPAQGFRISDVVKSASKAQERYSFGVGEQITALGDPQNGEYTADHLLQLLKNKRGSTNIDVLVGVVDGPIHDELFSAVDRENKSVVISSQANDIRNIVKRMKTTIEAYVLVEIAAQLLTIEYRRATNSTADPEDCELPWHKETKSCMFDYSDVFEHTAKKLITPKLCESCKAHLANNNIRGSAIDACMRIVNLAVRPKVYTLVRDVFQNRVIGFLFSGWLVLILADFLKSLIPLWGLSLLILGIVAVWVFIQYRKIPSIKT